MKNLIKLSLSTFLLSSIAYAQTTMCFKENHKDLSTLESVKLDGGECNSKYSLTQMKENGWSVEDIKINNGNYIYILKKGTTQSNFATTGSNVDMAQLERNVMAKLEKKQKAEKVQKEIETKAQNALNGKNIYVEKCQSCHGQKGEIEAGMGKALNTLTNESFQDSIDGYRNGTYNLGNAMIMKSYAYAISDNDVTNIYDYLQSLK